MLRYKEAPVDTKTITPPREAWSIAEVAASYGLSRGTVCGLISTGKLATRRVGRRLLIPDAAVKAWFASLSGGAA